MAPEVMQLGVGVGLEVETPHAYGPPADVYSLGSLLYEMAAGHVPYKGQAPPQIAFNGTTSPCVTRFYLLVTNCVLAWTCHSP